MAKRYYGYGQSNLDGSQTYYYNDGQGNWGPMDESGNVAPIQPIGVPQPKKPNPIAQAIGGYTGYKANEAINKGVGSLFGGGSTVAAPSGGIPVATGLDGSTVYGFPGGGVEASAGLGTAGTLLAGAAALHGGYGLYQGMKAGSRKASAISGAEAGAGVGTMILPGVGTAIGAAGGALTGALLGHVLGGKSQAQRARDSERQVLKDAGLASADPLTGKGAVVKLADGSTYDIGKDGGTKLTNKDGKTRNAYDSDFSDPTTGQTIGWTQPLAAIALGQGQGKAKDDMTGYLTNAVQSNAQGNMDKIKANTQALLSNWGVSKDQAISRLSQLKAAGKLTDDDYGAYVNGLNTLLGNSQKSQQGSPSSGNIVIQVNSPSSVPVYPKEDKFATLMNNLGTIQSNNTGQQANAYASLINSIKKT
jgi:hypothetical protein